MSVPFHFTVYGYMDNKMIPPVQELKWWRMYTCSPVLPFESRTRRSAPNSSSVLIMDVWPS